MAFKKRLLFIGLILTAPAGFSATVPAEVFSRANCKFYIPKTGYGWYNESISYDALSSQHKNMHTKTEQKANTGNTRTENSNTSESYRAKAGFMDPSTDTKFWNVTGTHYETLDSGRAVSQYTAAKDCNGKIGQVL